MEMMLQPIRRYADFEGRSRRSEYWMFVLGIFIFELVCGVVVNLGGAVHSVLYWLLSGLFGLALLGLFVPSLAVAFRRLHDTDRSAWWLLIGLLPFLGAVALLVFYCLDGTPGPNRFGPDPKGRGGDPTVFS